jgi:glycosyltransferase involved in cell wall biosynthesis
MNPWLLVSGDFVTTGGMDQANHALAIHLADSGREVHLVAHRVAQDLVDRHGIVWHRVARPAGSHTLGAPLLDVAGRRWAARLGGRARVVKNGGNCAAPGASWLHYVHAAWTPDGIRALALLRRRRDLRQERERVGQAPLVIANSERTRRDAIARLGVEETRVRVVAYGIDADTFRPPSGAERTAARARLELAADETVVGFVGALDDGRKGFHTVLEAWRRPAMGSRVTLVVAGGGRALPRWRESVRALGLQSRIRLLGFRDDVRDVLWACDALIAPSRYEAFGLAAQEALACGVPALVSRAAGVAERYPSALASLLIEDPADPAALQHALELWMPRREALAVDVRALSDVLRQRSWNDMARELVSEIEGVLG